MNIIDFFFGIFKECFNVLNVDFFGFGFTWLEFILAGTLLFIIISFLKGVVGVGDSFDFDGIIFGLKRQSQISNANRENEISSMSITKNLDSGVITIRQQKYYKDKNFTESYITSSKVGGK